MNSYYTKIITSNKNHVCHLKIEIKEDKLFISCHYYINYFSTNFYGEFSLDQLKSQSDYYKQFQKVNQIIGEIRNRNAKDINKDEVIELEDPNKMKIIINLTGNLYRTIPFELNKKEKTAEEILAEYKVVVKKYEAKCQIIGMKRTILNTAQSNEYIKAWISPIFHLQANLLYSYQLTYPEKPDKSLFGTPNFKIMDDKEVKKFHSKCDGVSSILVLCKSGTQIFGGYTPLSFGSGNNYKYDNDSFLFSLNHFKKYPKNNHKANESIWCYKNFGPCFYYDLEFVEGTMNMVRSNRTNYLLPDNFIDLKQCVKYSSDILIEILEIYQVLSYEEAQ